jgi:hypothetical protein
MLRVIDETVTADHAVEVDVNTMASSSSLSSSTSSSTTRCDEDETHEVFLNVYGKIAPLISL